MGGRPPSLRRGVAPRQEQTNRQQNGLDEKGQSKVLVNRVAFRRELMLRCGPMVIVAAVAHLILGVGPWVWLIPLAVAAMVVLKWAIPLGNQEGDADLDTPDEQDSVRR